MIQRLCGIDVSAKKLDVMIGGPGRKNMVSMCVTNDSKGHKDLIKKLTKKGAAATVCLEATGNYSLDIALALHRSKRIEVMVVNPKAAKNLGGALMKRGKTDPTDAGILFEFVQRMPFVAWSPPSEATLNLRTISRRLSDLTKALGAEKNHLHAASSTETTPDVVREDIHATMEHLRTRISFLERSAVELISQDSDLKRKYELLLSIKGIARTSAIRILPELALLPVDMGVRQWVAYAGLDPRPYQSGSSVRRQTRISKTGNVHLRAALYMPALVAVRSEEAVACFYNDLLANGKKKMVATVAVMRKLLHAIYGMFRHDTVFDAQRFRGIRLTAS